MDVQRQIRYQAEQQNQVFNDVADFVKDAQKRDAKASDAARAFDPKSVVLPAVRGQVDVRQDVEFAKAQGNELFKKKKFAEALAAYQEILDTFQDAQPDQKSSVYFNMGLCYQKTQPTSFVLQENFFSLALSLQPSYEKARVKRAKVLMEMNEWQRALDDLHASGRSHAELEADIQKCISMLQKPANAKIVFEESDQGDDADAADNVGEISASPTVAAPVPAREYVPSYNMESTT